MAYNVVLTDDALVDIQQHVRAGNKKLIAKIESFFEELELDPRQGRGKPEQLKHEKEETWSRRVDKKHRMTYRIFDNTVTVVVIATWGHYSDR